jgi:hypothetical protein
VLGLVALLAVKPKWDLLPFEETSVHDTEAFSTSSCGLKAVKEAFHQFSG